MTSCDVIKKVLKGKYLAVIHTFCPNWRFPVITTLCNCETVTLGIKMLYFHCFIARHVGNSTRALSVSVNTIKTCIHRDLFLYNHESNEPQAMNQEQLNILSWIMNYLPNQIRLNKQPSSPHISFPLINTTGECRYQSRGCQHADQAALSFWPQAQWLQFKAESASMQTKQRCLFGHRLSDCNPRGLPCRWETDSVCDYQGNTGSGSTICLFFYF